MLAFFSSIGNKTTENFISHTLKQRRNKRRRHNCNLKEILNQLHYVNYFLKKRGKACVCYKNKNDTKV